MIITKQHKVMLFFICNYGIIYLYNLVVEEIIAMKIYINKKGAGFDVFVKTKPETYVSFNNKKTPVMAAISFVEHQLQPIVICCSDKKLWLDLVQQEFLENKEIVIALMGLDTKNEYLNLSSNIFKNAKSCHLDVEGVGYIECWSELEEKVILKNKSKKAFKIRRYDIQLETKTEQRLPAFSKEKCVSDYDLLLGKGGFLKMGTVMGSFWSDDVKSLIEYIQYGMESNIGSDVIAAKSGANAETGAKELDLVMTKMKRDVSNSHKLKIFGDMVSSVIVTI